jgi:Xaa-Pro aminopeptidase
MYTISEFSDSLSQVKATKVAIDKNSCTQKYYELLQGTFKSKNVMLMDISPVSYLRVIKTQTEIKGMEQALKLESAALIAFYAELEDRVTNRKEVIYEHMVPEILN